MTTPRLALGCMGFSGQLAIGWVLGEQPRLTQLVGTRTMAHLDSER